MSRTTAPTRLQLPGFDRAGACFPLIDPEDGSPLRCDSPHSLAGEGGGRWPVVEGIPYLRIGRGLLRKAALEFLDAGDERSAAVALLGDQDDYARVPPRDERSLSRLIEAVGDGSASLRDAMAALGFGPVADYFAYRWSAPTYLSGLTLLQRQWLPGAAVVEVACGIGHYLRELELRDVPCVGVDVVFSKLWLARRYVVAGDVGLVCGDAAGGWPIGLSSAPAVAFCHDALYFLPDKRGVIASLRGTIGDGGRILIGHAHNRRFDHRGVSGEPLTPEEYGALLPNALMYDDAELARSFWAGTAAPPRDPHDLGEVEAVALAWEPSGRIREPGAAPPLQIRFDITPAMRSMRLNPLLAEVDGALRPRWPSARFEAEYAAESGYLVGEPMPRLDGPWIAGLMDDEEGEIDRLARLRILLDLPERW